MLSLGISPESLKIKIILSEVLPNSSEQNWGLQVGGQDS